MAWTELSRRARAEISCESAEQMLRRGDYAAAKTNFLAALSLYPTLVGAYLGMAKAECGLGRHKEAESFARAALETDPQNGIVAHFLGSLLFDLGRLAESLPLLQAAVIWAPCVAE